MAQVQYGFAEIQVGDDASHVGTSLEFLFVFVFGTCVFILTTCLAIRRGI